MSGFGPDHEVVIVGAGFVGLYAAIRLRSAGVTDFVILERANDIGGTWRDNRYPGVAVDIPSLMYQFSFAQTGSWNRMFAKGAEVKYRTTTGAVSAGTTSNWSLIRSGGSDRTPWKPLTGKYINPSCNGSNGYYLDRDGQPSIVRPQSSMTARWRASRFPLSDYELTELTDPDCLRANTDRVAAVAAPNRNAANTT
jgi:hypothetical protein